LEAVQATYWPDLSPVLINKVAAQPTEVEAGGTLLLSAVFEGPEEGVLVVFANLREATDLKFPLNDDGLNGDERAGDNIWSSLIQVPSYAPKGQFHFDILAIDKDLNGIYLPGAIKAEKRELGSLIFSVK
ncbi:MAG: choice-of-anchor X domain-containing protein, partial [Candidatus Aminicenantales bacterium]